MNWTKTSTNQLRMKATFMGPGSPGITTTTYDITSSESVVEKICIQQTDEDRIVISSSKTSKAFEGLNFAFDTSNSTMAIKNMVFVAISSNILDISLLKDMREVLKINQKHAAAIFPVLELIVAYNKEGKVLGETFNAFFRINSLQEFLFNIMGHLASKSFVIEAQFIDHISEGFSSIQSLDDTSVSSKMESSASNENLFVKSTDQIKKLLAALVKCETRQTEKKIVATKKMDFKYPGYYGFFFNLTNHIEVNYLNLDDKNLNLFELCWESFAMIPETEGEVFQEANAALVHYLLGSTKFVDPNEVNEYETQLFLAAHNSGKQFLIDRTFHLLCGGDKELFMRFVNINGDSKALIKIADVLKDPTNKSLTLAEITKSALKGEVDSEIEKYTKMLESAEVKLSTNLSTFWVPKKSSSEETSAKQEITTENPEDSVNPSI